MTVANYSFVLFFVVLNTNFTLFAYNGKKYNRGDILEMIYKSVLGYIPEKDSNGTWRDSADIPQLFCSVKSEGFSLCKEWLGDTKEQIIEKFFTGVYAKQFAYIIPDWKSLTITVYTMDRETFREFLEQFATLDYDSRKHTKKLRVKHETNKLKKWLEQNTRG